jgi:hypothetical protein
VIVEEGRVTLHDGTQQTWLSTPAVTYALIDYYRYGLGTRGLSELRVLHHLVTQRMSSHTNQGRTLASAMRRTMDHASVDNLLTIHVAPRDREVVREGGKKNRNDEKRGTASGARAGPRDGLCDNYQQGQCRLSDCKYKHECRKCHRRGHGSEDCRRGKDRSRSPERRRDEGRERDERRPHREDYKERRR